MDDSWRTQYVRDTCKLPGANGPARVLGVDLGLGAAAAQFEARAQAVGVVHSVLASVADAPAEVTLTRMCARSNK
eukprot:1124375-Alexandrium_andersonii.AAC.1